MITDEAKVELEKLQTKEQELKAQIKKTRKEIKSYRQFLISIGALDKKGKK